MTHPRPRANLDALRPYQAVTGPDLRFNLSANEACLGPSPAALAAAAEAATSIDRYPDGAAGKLRLAIGTRYGLDPELIIVGAGSEELISLLVQAYVAPGEEVLFSQYGFIKYELAARAHAAIPVRAPEVEFTADVDALLAAVTPRTRLVFLANPNNPTGTYLRDAQVRRLREQLAEHIVLVVDAAYAEFVERADNADGLALARSTPNTVALRTFSKIHGLAGLRCGWGYGAREIVDVLHKIRGAFNVSAVAQAAAAAAIADTAHESRSREHNIEWLSWLSTELLAAGLEVIPSVCNFLVVRFQSAGACAAAITSLNGHGVLAMPLTGYGLPEALRITVGTESANQAVLAALAGGAA
jgi:histidinol-phosphate aminotransferase